MIMEDIKNYMNQMIITVLKEMGFPREQIESTAASMAYALGSLNDRDYLEAMGGAFGGHGDMEAVNDFLSATYEMPNT
jgi:hypothetical protein